MATDNRLEFAWVSFADGVRLAATSGSAVPAVAKSEGRRLFFGMIQGLPFVIMEDVSLAQPATFPWHNVASVGWLNPPAVEWPSELPKGKHGDAGRFQKKVATEEPVA